MRRHQCWIVGQPQPSAAVELPAAFATPHHVPQVAGQATSNTLPAASNAVGRIGPPDIWAQQAQVFNTGPLPGFVGAANPFQPPAPGGQWTGTPAAASDDTTRAVQASQDVSTAQAPSHDAIQPFLPKPSAQGQPLLLHDRRGSKHSERSLSNASATASTNEGRNNQLPSRSQSKKPRRSKDRSIISNARTSRDHNQVPPDPWHTFFYAQSLKAEQRSHTELPRLTLLNKATDVVQFEDWTSAELAGSRRLVLCTVQREGPAQSLTYAPLACKDYLPDKSQLIISCLVKPPQVVPLPTVREWTCRSALGRIFYAERKGFHLTAKGEARGLIKSPCCCC